MLNCRLFRGRLRAWKAAIWLLAGLALISGPSAADTTEASACRPRSIDGYQSTILERAIAECAISCQSKPPPWIGDGDSAVECAKKCACAPLSRDYYTSGSTKVDTLDVVAVQVVDANGVILPLSRVSSLQITASAVSRARAPEVILRHNFSSHRRAQGDFVLVQLDRKRLGATPGDVIELKVTASPVLAAIAAQPAVLPTPAIEAVPAAAGQLPVPAQPARPGRPGMPAIAARAGSEATSSFFVKLNNSWEAYGEDDNGSSLHAGDRERLGFWVPVGLFGAHFAPVSDDGLTFAATPIAIAFGTKTHITSTFELGISVFAGYTLSSSTAKVEGQGESFGWQSGSFGVLLEIKSRAILGLGYTLDTRKLFKSGGAPSPYRHPGTMLVFGVPFNLLDL